MPRISSLPDSLATSIKYDKNAGTDDWKIVNDSNAPTEYLHNEKTKFEVYTLLVNEVEAQNLADFYINLIKDPPDKVEVTLPPEALNIMPADKVYFTRSIRDMQNQEVTILDEELYLIINTRKNFKDCSIDVKAILDSQATGTGGYADIEHCDTHDDSHTDSHTDSAHTDTHDDVTHVDTHGDTHTDEPHGDTHNDHDDVVHLDNHADHDDTAHTDTHSDTPHSDEHGDGYDDSYDDEHTDEHCDIPHTDSET